MEANSSLFYAPDRRVFKSAHAAVLYTIRLGLKGKVRRG